MVIYMCINVFGHWSQSFDFLDVFGHQSDSSNCFSGQSSHRTLLVGIQMEKLLATVDHIAPGMESIFPNV